MALIVRSEYRLRHLRAIAPIRPKNEAQVRHLIGLSDEQAVTTWIKAIELAQGGPVTASLVKVAAAGLKAEPRSTKKDKLETDHQTSEFSEFAPANPAKTTICRLIESAAIFVRRRQDPHNILRLFEDIKERVRRLPGC